MTQVVKAGTHARVPARDQAALIARALTWCELFSQWPDAQRQVLQQQARVVRYSRRTLVLSHDAHCRELLCVVNGCIEVSCVNADGNKYVNALVGPSSTLPMVRLLRDRPLTYSYYALLDSTIVHLPADTVRDQLDAHPILWRHVAELVMHRQRNSLAALRKQLLSSNRQRLAGILADLAHIHGRNAKGDDEGHVSIEINQSDLAAMLGATRQTVNKELHRLMQLGIVDIAYGRIVVRDMDQLRQQAG
ncbi:Crp/Fnr family transcriptional regulator [Comamonas serinivorans]|uniref:Crp/Fnr family transcriptional regulator n=1 Tax=Comamonas serinivorans TaxID=1082851 RepID=UPI001F469821|nr:Crp/Fnr family transcriptional regulator [Comamonas serinivorans]